MKQTEHGYPGHYIMASRCRFHRHTSLEAWGLRLTVSTVGQLNDYHGEFTEGSFPIVQVGLDCFFETCVFLAGHYYAVPGWPIFDERAVLNEVWLCDEADEMHNRMVRKVRRWLRWSGWRLALALLLQQQSEDET